TVQRLLVKARGYLPPHNFTVSRTSRRQRRLPLGTAFAPGLRTLESQPSRVASQRQKAPAVHHVR
ncbi:hypothetical protein, partial [Parathermosynechococcus lividus]